MGWSKDSLAGVCSSRSSSFFLETTVCVHFVVLVSAASVVCLLICFEDSVRLMSEARVTSTGVSWLLGPQATVFAIWTQPSTNANYVPSAFSHTASEGLWNHDKKCRTLSALIGEKSLFFFCFQRWRQAKLQGCPWPCYSPTRCNTSPSIFSIRERHTLSPQGVVCGMDPGMFTEHGRKLALWRNLLGSAWEPEEGRGNAFRFGSREEAYILVRQRYALRPSWDPLLWTHPKGR